MEFLKTHKRLLLIVLVAIVIIAAAYYFILGKEGTSSSSSSGLALPFSSSNGKASGSNTFPLLWGVKNSNTVAIQKRLNQTIQAYKNAGKTITGYPSMQLLSEDGILGSNTLASLQASFPNIGSSVAAMKQISQAQYETIVNSKVSTPS